jgi:hypothetical protein
MHKLAILSQIHGLIQYMHEVPQSCFTEEGKRRAIVKKLVEYYKTVASHGTDAELAAAYQDCVTAIQANIADQTVQARVKKTVDDVNGDVQPTP